MGDLSTAVLRSEMARSAMWRSASSTSTGSSVGREDGALRSTWPVSRLAATLSLACVLVLAAVATAGVAIDVAGSVAEAKTVIEWWDDHSYEQLEAFQEVIALFEQRNPDIEIRLSLVDPAVYYDRLAISFASGVGPDIFYLHDFQAAPWHSRGYTTDLEPYLAKSDYDVSEIWPAKIPLMSVDGKLHGLPYDWSLVGLYYNAQLFDEHGVPYPDESWTWQDLADWGRQFRLDDSSGNQIRWGYAPFPITWGGWNVFGELYSFGASLFSEDGRSATVNSTATEEYFRFMHELRLNGVTPYRVQSEGISEYQLFTQGTVAMMSNGSWAMLSFDQAEFEWDVSYQPAGPSGRWVTATGGHYAISSASEKKDAAWEFLRFLASPEAQYIMNVKHFRSLPGLRSVAIEWAEAALLGDGPSGAVTFVEVAQHHAVGVPAVPYWTMIAPTVMSTFSQVFEGEISPGQAMAQLETAIQAAIARTMR